MSEQKNYIWGSAREVETRFGPILNISLKLEDLQKIVDEKGYCKISVTRRKEKGRYGETHTVIENTYKPKEKDTVDGPWH